MNEQFAADVDEGLSAERKFIPSKYFYDEKGDRIFQKIMELDEYYLTRKEFSILSTYKKELLNLCSSEGLVDFSLIEFGAGDGTKTKILLEHFLANDSGFQYIPVDISGSVLKELMKDLETNFPKLNGHAIQDDYFDALRKINFDGDAKKVILFLGSNIGNFLEDEANDFLGRLAENLNVGDQVLIGFDLMKDPKVLMDAYDDKKGVTAEFNLNLLSRINGELGGNFVVDCFQHVAKYDPVTGAMESFLVSKRNQDVKIDATGKTYHFDAWEAIHTEISQKYSIKTIERLASNAGFEIVNHFMDDQEYFNDSLWELKST